MKFLSKINKKKQIFIGGFTHRATSGFTAIELVVVIGITALLAGLTVTTFVSLSNTQSVDKDADVAVSYVTQARNQTINSKGNISYGVKFASSTVTLFQGTVYNAAASTNVVYNISTKVSASLISLTGNATSLYFMPISGEPSATGTVKYKLNTNASSTKTVTIYGSGLAEVQ